TLTQTFYQHNMYSRLDYRMLNSLRFFGSWNYGYSRTRGTLGQPDSAWGQLSSCGANNCNGSGTDPSSLRSDNGTVNPLSVYAFGGDWTPNSKTVISSRFGYFFYNNETRGTPTGVRYFYDNSVAKSDPTKTPDPCTKDLTGACLPSTVVNSSGFSNIPSTYATFFDAFKRKSTNTDVS